MSSVVRTLYSGHDTHQHIKNACSENNFRVAAGEVQIKNAFLRFQRLCVSLALDLLNIALLYFAGLFCARIWQPEKPGNDIKFRKTKKVYVVSLENNLV